MPFPLTFPIRFEDKGWLMALTDEQQMELLTKVRFIFDQLNAPDPAWKWLSLGKNSAGQELTWRDAFGVLQIKVDALQAKVDALIRKIGG